MIMMQSLLSGIPEEYIKAREAYLVYQAEFDKNVGKYYETAENPTWEEALRLYGENQYPGRNGTTFRDQTVWFVRVDAAKSLSVYVTWIFVLSGRGGRSSSIPLLLLVISADPSVERRLER